MSILETRAKDSSILDAVWIDGCFDLVHFGHANAIRQAKSNARKLIVGVHSDNEIMKSKKSKPIFNEQERYKLVRAIKWVDEVVENVPYETKIETLDKYHCDVCMHGDDIVFDKNGQDLYAPFKKLGRYREFQRTEGVSTTDILERIISAYKKLTKKESFETVSRDSKSEPKIFSPYTSGNTKYYLNTMRISQFSGGAVNLEPKLNDKIIYCPGNFDLFHIGHVEFLEKASKLGDYLIVGLYGDKQAHFEAGKMGTVLRLEERMLSVLACRYVNNVIADVPYVITEKFLCSYKIDLVVVGNVSKLESSELTADPIAVPKAKGIFRRIESHSGVTTPNVIERIVRNKLEISARNELKQKKEVELIEKLRISSNL